MAWFVGLGSTVPVRHADCPRLNFSVLHPGEPHPRSANDTTGHLTPSPPVCLARGGMALRSPHYCSVARASRHGGSDAGPRWSRTCDSVCRDSRTHGSCVSLAVGVADHWPACCV